MKGISKLFSDPLMMYKMPLNVHFWVHVPSSFNLLLYTSISLSGIVYMMPRCSKNYKSSLLALLSKFSFYDLFYYVISLGVYISLSSHALFQITFLGYSTLHRPLQLFRSHRQLLLFSLHPVAIKLRSYSFYFLNFFSDTSNLKFWETVSFFLCILACIFQRVFFR